MTTTKPADDERVRRRELTKGVCCMIAMVAGTYFGLSPLILPVSAVFGPNSGVFFHGVAVLTVGYTTTSSAPEHKTHLQYHSGLLFYQGNSAITIYYHL